MPGVLPRRMNVTSSRDSSTSRSPGTRQGADARSGPSDSWRKRCGVWSRTRPSTVACRSSLYWISSESFTRAARSIFPLRASRERLSTKRRGREYEMSEPEPRRSPQTQGPEVKRAKPLNRRRDERVRRREAPQHAHHELAPTGNPMRVRGLGPRTFPAKRRPQPRSESAAFAPLSRSSRARPSRARD